MRLAVERLRARIDSGQAPAQECVGALHEGSVLRLKRRRRGIVGQKGARLAQAIGVVRQIAVEVEQSFVHGAEGSRGLLRVELPCWIVLDVHPERHRQ